MEAPQQFDPLLTPMVVRHRMGMPVATANSAANFVIHNKYHSEAVEPNQRQYNNNGGGVVQINGNNNTVRWSCQSYESGITELSFNSFDESSQQASRVNVHEMLDRGFEETEVLRRWLDSFGLLCYFDCFLLAGYDSLAIMSRMTTEDLTAIGITEPNHRRRLKHELGKLQFTDNYAESVNDNLFDFLTQLGLEHYTGALTRTGCDTTTKLLQLELDDLEDVGVAKLGHQKRLYLAIKHYCKLTRRHSRMSVTSATDCHHRHSMQNPNYHNVFDAATASRPPLSPHHRLSATTTLMRNHHQQSPSNTSEKSKIRPQSMTKQLSTFLDAPRSPNVQPLNSSAAAVAANFVQNGGLNDRNSLYGIISENTTTTQQQKQNEIYSTGSINNLMQQNNITNGQTFFRPHSSTPEPHYHRTSFNYSPLRFPLKNASTNNTGGGDSPTSRNGSVHSGPPGFLVLDSSRQQSVNYQSTQQSSPTHSLGRLSFLSNTHNAPLSSSPTLLTSQNQLQRSYTSSTPPPPGMAQYLTQNQNNYAIANGHATLPRTSSSLSLSAGRSSLFNGNTKKMSPSRICDTIGEPANDDEAGHESSAAFTSENNKQANKRAQQVPPPPPPRARQTTLDYNISGCVTGDFPPPPSPLQVPSLFLPPAQRKQLFSENYCHITGNDTVASPATTLLSRKQPPVEFMSDHISGAFNTTVRGGLSSNQTTPFLNHQLASGPFCDRSLHELFAVVTSSTTAGSSGRNLKSTANVNNNISPDCIMSIGVTSSADSGNSSASSVDEEHDARTSTKPSASIPQQHEKVAQNEAVQASSDSQREPEDVLNEISGMLASLTDELDHMLKY